MWKNAVNTKSMEAKSARVHRPHSCYARCHVSQLPSALLVAFAARAETLYFTIKIVDAQTGRGVPLVEVETVNHVRFVTDNAGLVAFAEPGLMDREVFFHVRSHGYEFPKDGFGFAGKKLTPHAGARVELKINRRNIAERLYRITGEGLYRDTILAGEKPPLREPLLNAQVLGQDLHAGRGVSRESGVVVGRYVAGQVSARKLCDIRRDFRIARRGRPAGERRHRFALLRG